MTRWKRIQPKAVGGGMKCPALGWTQLAWGGGGNARENSPPPTTNQRWRISWWFQCCICSFFGRNGMMQYVCLDFWWNVGDGRKLVSTAWNKFSPCCSHLMVETYCCSYKWTANFQERISTGQQVSQRFWRLMESYTLPRLPSWDTLKISRFVGSLRSFLLSSYSKHCRMLIVNVVIVCETNSWVVSRFDVICIRFSHETYEQHQPPYDGLLTGKGEPTLQWNIISCKG